MKALLGLSYSLPSPDCRMRAPTRRPESTARCPSPPNINPLGSATKKLVSLSASDALQTMPTTRHPCTNGTRRAWPSFSTEASRTTSRS